MKATGDSRYELVVMGASWGGLEALETVLGGLPGDFAASVAIAQHRSPDGAADGLATLLGAHCRLPLEDADDKQAIAPGHVYLAPADYHLYVEDDGLALSMDEAVLFSRPSIDVLFESASEVYRERLVGVVLTGANEDGAAGLAAIKRRGGYAIVQDPDEAERSEMPRAALRATKPDRVLTVGAIAAALVELCGSVVSRARAGER
jgi:two-component system, chemotaxis family, protein-glutamate methylesterase/glutaminase